MTMAMWGGQELHRRVDGHKGAPAKKDAARSLRLDDCQLSLV